MTAKKIPTPNRWPKVFAQIYLCPTNASIEGIDSFAFQAYLLGLIFFSVYIVLRCIAIIALMLELASILLSFTGPGVEVVIELIFCTLVTFILKSRFYKK